MLTKLLISQFLIALESNAKTQYSGILLVLEENYLNIHEF